MKSFFSGLKLGAPSTPPASGTAQAAGLKRSPSQAESHMPEMLGKAEKLLGRLRNSTAHDFPLLNEATRLVQLLEGAVTKMPDTDMKGVWREQVNELQRSLQSATEQMLAQDAKPANDPPAVKQSHAGKPARQGAGKAQEASSSGGYSAPTMPVDSVDMFSGLDLPGFAPAAEPVQAEPEQTQTSMEPLVQRSSGSIPLPADLFSGLEHLSVESSAPSQPDPFLSAANAPPSSPARTVASAAAPKSGPVLSGLSIPAQPSSQPTSIGQNLDHSSPRSQRANTISGLVPAAAPAAASVTAPEGRRKKKTTRRVGYARDQTEDSSAERSTSGSSLPAGMPQASATPAPSVGAHTAPVAAQPAPSDSAASASVAASAASPAPSASAAAKQPAITSKQTHKAASMSSNGSLSHRLQSLSPSVQPASPVKASAAQPRTADSPTKHYKAGRTSAPVPVVQASSLSLHDAVAAASLTAPAQPMLPALRNQQAVPAALTPETLLQAAKGSSFEGGLQAVQGRAEQQIAALAASIKAAIQDEQAARQKRHSFTLEAVSDMGQVRQLEEAEQLAVEQEDFESAANLSSELDGLRAHIQALERSARGAEGECEAAVKRRVDTAVQQVTVWRAAAQAIAQLQAAQEQKAAKAAKHSQKEASKLADSIAASEEHVQELKGRITARQDWIAREQDSVDSKIEEATRPVAAQRTQATQQHSTLQEEVEELRRQLLEKETALAAAADKLADIDQHMHSLAAKYDKTLARLAEDRRAVATEEGERDAEEAAVQSSREQAVAAEAAAKEEQAQFDEQVAAAAAAASSMLSKAVAISAAVEAEGQLQQVQASLRDQEEQANDAVKELERELEGSRVAVRALASQRASLANEAGAAEAQAAAAQRRIPELETDKKAAAAARDFKGAAALSAEAKALAAQADIAAAKAKELRQQVSEAEEEEQMQVSNIKQQELQLTNAKKAAGLARWRRLQSSMQGLARQVEAAAAADKFDEATALQAELDSSTEEANALAAEHAFTSSDMQDLAALPTPLPEQFGKGVLAHSTAPSEQALKGTPATLAAPEDNPTSEPGSNTQAAAAKDAVGSGKAQTQDSQDLSNALSREGMLDYEDGESVEPDEDGTHVGYSSSVMSASHAATDGSRSVQSSRTVLDRMPEFNMDDAISFRSVSSSRSQSQAVNADTRSVRTMSTIVDDVDKPDEADETSSFRSMSSTTSTNYGAPKPRPSTTPLYTIPDEVAASEEGEEQQSSSQSETEAAQDLPASAAAQALHQEADELISSSQHASSSADSLADVSVDPTSELDSKGGGLGKGSGSNASFSGTSELGPVSEDESSRRTTSTGDYSEENTTVRPNMPPDSDVLAPQGQLPSFLTHQALSNGGANPSDKPTVSSTAKPEMAYPLNQGAMGNSSDLLDSDSMHTPRAMGPPATPGAPLVPKIDAGPAVDPSAELEQSHVTASEANTDLGGQQENAMFAGLDMM